MNNKSKKNFSTKEVIAYIILTGVLSSIMSYLIFAHHNKKVKYVEDENLSLFLEQYHYIIDNYYTEIEKSELINGAIAGMLSVLEDPYTTYYDENVTDTLNIKLTGYYEGLGIEIVKYIDGPILIINVFENSNAYKQGIRIGDLITEIDDIDVSTITNEDFLNNIKQNNKTFKLKIKRDEEEFTVNVTKSYININSVEYRKIDEYGYIKLNIFALNTYEQFKNAFNDLNGQDIKGLIIDLRDNTGGHLTIAENILSLFLNSDKVIYQTQNQTETKIVNSKGSKDYNLPIVIMVNENSASASELITSALMEQLGAIVVGKNTYGKGMIQKLVELPDGTEYKVTTDKWLTSKGIYIEGNGIEPTIEIDNLSEEEYINKVIEIIKKDQ